MKATTPTGMASISATIRMKKTQTAIVLGKRGGEPPDNTITTKARGNADEKN